MARVTILGRSGTGKSWFSGKMLADILHGDTTMESEGEDGSFEYAIHMDVEDEERGLSMEEDPLFATLTVGTAELEQVVSYDSKADAPDYIPPEQLSESANILYPKWAYYKNKHVRVVPDGLSKEEVKALTEMMADAAMKTGGCHFSLDEAHLIAEKHAIGDKLNRLITGGRKRGVEWLFITQRGQNLHEDILSQSDYSIYFNLTGRDAEKAAEKSEALPNPQEQIEALQSREAIIEDFNEGSWAEFSTEGMERKYPHVAGDDGAADPYWQSIIDEQD